jgi:hypothetical protein
MLNALTATCVSADVKIQLAVSYVKMHYVGLEKIEKIVEKGGHVGLFIFREI